MAWRKFTSACAVAKQAKVASEGQQKNPAPALTALNQDVGCLCCGQSFKPVTCTKKPASVTVYCSTCWSSNAERCRRITKQVIIVQKWWKQLSKPTVAEPPSQSYSLEDNYQHSNGLLVDHATRTWMEPAEQLQLEDLHGAKGRWDTHPAVASTRMVLLQWQLEGQFSDSTDFEIGEAIDQLSRAKATLDAVESMRATARATLRIAGANASMWQSLCTARWAFRMAEKLVGCPLTSEHNTTLSPNLDVVEKHANTWRQLATQARKGQQSQSYTNAESAIEWAEQVTPVRVANAWLAIAVRVAGSEHTGEIFEHMRALRRQKGPEMLAQMVQQELSAVRSVAATAAMGLDEPIINSYSPPRREWSEAHSRWQPLCILKSCNKKPVQGRKACCGEHFALAKEEAAIQVALQSSMHLFTRFPLEHK